jgi:hypothetical protein
MGQAKTPADPSALFTYHSPTVTALLNDVAELCRPTAPGWEAALRRRLTERLYRPLAEGEDLSREKFNAVLAELRRIAALVTRKPARAGDEFPSNGSALSGL